MPLLEKLSIRTKIAVFTLEPNQETLADTADNMMFAVDNSVALPLEPAFNPLQILLEKRSSLFSPNADQTLPMSLFSPNANVVLPPKPNE